MIKIFRRLDKLTDKQLEGMSLNEKVMDRVEKLGEEFQEVLAEIKTETVMYKSEDNEFKFRYVDKVVGVNTEKLVYELIDVIIVSLSFIKVLIGLELKHFLYMVNKKLNKWEDEQ